MISAGVGVAGKCTSTPLASSLSITGVLILLHLGLGSSSGKMGLDIESRLLLQVPYLADRRLLEREVWVRPALCYPAGAALLSALCSVLAVAFQR